MKPSLPASLFASDMLPARVGKKGFEVAPTSSQGATLDTKTTAKCKWLEVSVGHLPVCCSACLGMALSLLTSQVLVSQPTKIYLHEPRNLQVSDLEHFCPGTRISAIHLVHEDSTQSLPEFSGKELSLSHGKAGNSNQATEGLQKPAVLN